MSLLVLEQRQIEAKALVGYHSFLERQMRCDYDLEMTPMERCRQHVRQLEGSESNPLSNTRAALAVGVGNEVRCRVRKVKRWRSTVEAAQSGGRGFCWNPPVTASPGNHV